MSSLPQILREKLASTPTGRLPFAQVMDLALYHPGHGYYGSGPRKIGRQGDFFTSVSIGPLFGKLLALYALQEWRRLGMPEDFAIIEQGAHDGQLAEDVLNAVDCHPVRYIIVEPNPRFQTVQAGRLGSRVQWVESLDALKDGPAHGFYLCNELPDAFPVHLVRWSGTRWEELFVAADDLGGFHYVPGELSCEELAAEARDLPQDLDPGHTMEINLAMLAWIRTLARVAFRGSIFIADYGLDAEEFHASTRAEGTIRRYRQHQMDGQVLADLGECDLTSHVNFTRLITEAESHGLRQHEYDLQGRVLGRVATPWLKSLEGSPPDAATMRQFHSLTHPALMGRSFRCLVLEKPSRP